MIATARDIADLIGAAAFGGTPDLIRDKAEFAPAFWDLRSGLLMRRITPIRPAR